MERKWRNLLIATATSIGFIGVLISFGLGNACLLYTSKQHVKIKNPKRLQRMVKKQVNQKVSSKSKELLQLQYEERKKISKHQSSVQKQLLKQEKFERKQQKRRDKHKGH